MRVCFLHFCVIKIDKSEVVQQLHSYERRVEDEVQTGTRHVRRIFLYLNYINKLFVFMTE